MSPKCPPSVCTEEWSPLNWTVIIIEVLQIVFQVFIIKYQFLYIHGDSFNFLALAFAQFGLFFITSLLVALLFYSYTGTRRLQLLLTLFNYTKFVVDTISYASVALSHPLKIFDVLQINYLIQICRFLTICVFCHIGARCDFYTNYATKDSNEPEEPVIVKTEKKKDKDKITPGIGRIIANETGKPACWRRKRRIVRFN